MDRRELPQRFKNALFEKLQAAGLEPKEFTWDVVEGPWAREYQVSRVVHARTGSYFLFDVDSSGQYIVDAWPGGGVSEPVAPDWMMQLALRWIDNIAPDILAPDLWRLAAEQAKFTTDPGSANTAFTPAEQTQITEGLRQLEEFVYQAEPDLPTEKRGAIAARFEYLKKAATRLGRLDWMTLVVGQFFSMAVEKIISVQTFHSLYNMAGTLLGKALAAGGSFIGGLLGG